LVNFEAMSAQSWLAELDGHVVPSVSYHAKFRIRLRIPCNTAQTLSAARVRDFEVRDPE
jgi:hypothetical protein